MAGTSLSSDDVSKLLSDSSPEIRAETAAKIATDFSRADLSDSERTLAEEIFRLMVKDAEVRVREALALNLKENPSLPHDVAMAMAADVDSVSLPMLRYSEVLTDEDLIKIVHSQGVSKQVAIAERETVSESVSDALVETKDENVVSTLVGNEGAEISDITMGKAIEELGDREAVQNAMVHRSSLPMAVSERLLTLVSENLKEELAKRHEIDPVVATDLILQSRERAVMSLSVESDEDQLNSLIAQLHDNGRLTSSIMLRALCMGDLAFFETGVAKMIGVPVSNARTLIHDAGDLGLRTVFQRAGLPESHFPAARAAMDVVKEIEFDGRERDRERYARRMIERILTQYGDLGVSFDSDDLEYLLAKMDQLPADNLGAN